MITNAYSVPITVFRNRSWLQSFTLYDGDGTPFDVSSDTLALTILPTGPGVSGAVPIVTETGPLVTGDAGNTVVFTIADEEMGGLTAGAPYNWQFIRRPAGSGATSYSTVVVAGPLTVNDSPSFP
jgi:hypothetical protein